MAHAALKGLFFWGPYLSSVAIPIHNGTRGLITTVTVSGLIEWALLVGVLMVGVGRLRLRDIGLSTSALRDALPVLLAVWVVAQAAFLALGAFVGPMTEVVGGPGPWWSTGLRVQAVVGSGLIEEVLYRGFLLNQLYLRLRLRWVRESSMAWAAVATSLFFGLNHVPAGLHEGMGWLGAAGFGLQTALGGALFAALYLRTGNLFIAAGAHALVNEPVALAEAAIDPSLTVLVAVSVLLLAWPLLARRMGGVFTVGTIEGVPAV